MFLLTKWQWCTRFNIEEEPRYGTKLFKKSSEWSFSLAKNSAAILFRSLSIFYHPVVLCHLRPTEWKERSWFVNKTNVDATSCHPEASFLFSIRNKKSERKDQRKMKTLAFVASATCHLPFATCSVDFVALDLKDEKTKWTLLFRGIQPTSALSTKQQV